MAGLIAEPETDRLSGSIGEVKSVGIIAEPNTDGPTASIGEVETNAEIDRLLREVAARCSVTEVLVRLLAEPVLTRLLAFFFFPLSIRGITVEIYCD